MKQEMMSEKWFNKNYFNVLRPETTSCRFNWSAIFRIMDEYAEANKITMTENDMMILEIQNNRYLVTPKTEKSLKTYLFERYKKNKDITVKIFDQNTNELLDELPLNALYSE